MPPLLIRTNLVSALCSFTSDISLVPLHGMGSGSKSVVEDPVELSISKPASDSDSFGKGLSGLYGSPVAPSNEVATKNITAGEVLHTFNPPANPTVMLPEFTGQWVHVENADLNSLTEMVALSVNDNGPSENGNINGPRMSSGDGDWGGDWGYHLDNNDGYLLYLNTVTFSGTGFRPVYRDIAQTQYAPPHWKDLDHNNHDDRTENPQEDDPVLPGLNMGEPVSYGMGTQMVATIDFNLQYVPPGPLQPIDAFPKDNNVWIRGIAYYDVTKPPLITNVEFVGDPKANSPGLEYTLTFSPLMSTVYHWTDMTINWQYCYSEAPLAPDNPSWNTFNKSHNANYVTLAQSQNGKLFLTLADYGTLSAHGENTEAGTVAKMWTYVSNLNVYRSEDEHPLTYYGDWKTENVHLADLLEDSDSQCGGWSELWIESLKAHGILSASEVKVTPTVPGEYYLIKDWAFTNQLQTAINIRNIDYNYYNQWNGNDFYNNSQYTFDANSYNVTDVVPGVPGQFSSNPKSDFNLHFIVKYKNLYYDPSYGKTYTNETDMQVKSIVGFYTIAGDTWWIRKKSIALQVQFE